MKKKKGVICGIANAAAFLLNDMATGITGKILYVDAGYHILTS